MGCQWSQPLKVRAKEATSEDLFAESPACRPKTSVSDSILNKSEGLSSISSLRLRLRLLAECTLQLEFSEEASILAAAMAFCLI